MSIYVDTLQPKDNKNTEEYRSQLLVNIESLKARENELFNQLYTSNTSSGTWKLLALVSGVFFVIVILFNHSETRETLLTISLLGLILGIYQTKHRTKEEKRLSYLLDNVKNKLKKANEAYSYAFKFKDKELIYEPNSGYLNNKKLYGNQ